MGAIRKPASLRLGLPVKVGFEDLVAKVAANGGVLTVRAGGLRNRYGADRLGINVRHAISKELAELGIAHYPSTIPERQEELVRLYSSGSPVAELVEAVRSASRNPTVKRFN